MKLSKQCKRILSLVLAVLFLASSVPTSVYAADVSVIPETAQSTVTEESETPEADTNGSESDADISHVSEESIESKENSNGEKVADPGSDGQVVQQSSGENEEKTAVKNSEVALFEAEAAETPVGGSCGENATWSFDEASGVLTISGNGAVDNYTASTEVWSEYKNSVKKVVIEQGITSVGNYSFRAYGQLETVELAASVKTIGDHAFELASKLNQINLEKVTIIGSNAFTQTNLTSVSLDEAKTIGQQAFAVCNSLKSITLGNDENCVESIGKRSFSKCVELTDINFQNVKEIGEEAFSESGMSCIDLSNVQSVGENAFKAATALKSVNFGNKPISIAMMAFNGAGLEEVQIPPTVSMALCTFYNCKQLKNVVIEDGNTKIPDSCFCDCTSLVSVILPKSLACIEQYAFDNCTSLANVSYGGTTEDWKKITIGEGNDALTSLMQTEDTKVTSVSLNKTELELSVGGETETLAATVLPEGATNKEVTWSSDNEQVATVDETGKVSPVGAGEATITVTTQDGNYTASCKVTVADSEDPVGGNCGENATWSFDAASGVLTISGSGAVDNYTTGTEVWSEYKNSVKKVVIEQGITSVGNYSFRAYDQLETVELAASVKTIGDHAFELASKLNQINLEKVTTIGSNAFAQTNLPSVSLDEAKTIGQQAFAVCNSLKSITLGSDENCVESIGKQSFGKCPELTDINFRNVKEIGEEAFSASGMTSIDLSNVQSVGKKAFINTARLKTVTFGNASITVGNQAFNSAALESVSIPGNVTLDNYAFYKCTKLVSVHIGEGVTAIPASCFNQDAALQNITLPKSLTTIGKNAFYKCTSLASVSYGGTTEDWKKVAIEDGNDALTSLMQTEDTKVIGVSLNKTELELSVGGETETLVATVLPEDATNKDVTWSSDNEQVAMVDETGKVSPVGAGEATITVTTQDGNYTASCKVTVADSEEAIDLTKFNFTVNNPKYKFGDTARFTIEYNKLAVEKTEDGSYRLLTPTYAIENSADHACLSIQAPDDVTTPFTVSYKKWISSSKTQEETVHSENGTVTIPDYYYFTSNKGPLYSDLSLKFEGGDRVYTVSLSIYNELRTILIKNKTDEAVVTDFKQTGATTFETTLYRNQTYSLYFQGGIYHLNAVGDNTNCTVSDGVTQTPGGRDVSVEYTPGEETSKDFSIHVATNEASWGIADGDYTLHVKVEDAPENLLKFEKYVCTVNGQEYDIVLEENSSYCYIPELTQRDTLSVRAVVANADDTAVYKWRRWNKELPQENKNQISVDTTSSNQSSYQFDCNVSCNGQEISLPHLDLRKFEILDIPAPEIITQPTGGEYPVGSQITLSAVSAKPEQGTLWAQWYRCSDATAANAEKIGVATYINPKVELNYNYEASYTVPSTEAGSYWYYCELYSTYGEITSAIARTDCVRVDVLENRLPLSGKGTKDDPYQLTNADELNAVREAVAAGTSFDGMYFKFTEDITLPSGWVPMGCTKDGSDVLHGGKNLNPFSGNIDGAGHTLTVLAGGLPLLGYVVNASVSNLNIYGTQIDGYGLVEYYQGIGLSGSGIVIDNVTLKSGTRTLKSGFLGTKIGSDNNFAGASATFTATIRNCTVEKDVVIGYNKDQSMIGSFAGRANCVIENCKSEATVYGVNYVGGILGTRDNAMGTCAVSGCSFGGSVVASGDHAGGIVGGGYSNSTAPNGIKVTINHNKVTGSVTGKDKVGGILGADSYVAQAWNHYTLKLNSFTGTVKATEGTYIGGIIGYYSGLNKMDDIAGNTYSGAERGIGFIKYLDTSCENAKGLDGTVLIDTSKGTDGLPYVAGCNWVANYNRTDDPLGKDADKLWKKLDSEGTEENICYDLKASGTYKTEYVSGEALDLTGIVLTGTWTDGSTKEISLKDVTIEGYDTQRTGNQTVILTYGLGKAYITVKVTPKPTRIKVTVFINGDSKHKDPTANKGPHGLARGGLTTWAKAIDMEADTADTVWDVLKRVLDANKLTYDADANNQYNSLYIKSVNGLGEFDNGENSGWMYTVNDHHPEVGVDAKYVKDGDVIVLHYTDDYSYEEDGANFGKDPSAKPSTPDTKPSTPDTKPSTPDTKPSTPATKPADQTPSTPAHTHVYGEWMTTVEATVFAPAQQERSCSCGQKETRSYGSALQPTISVNATTIPLKRKQTTTGFKVTGLANGDAVTGYASSNKKIFTVDARGKIKAGKKTGKATLTITLKSGLQKKVIVKVQKKNVKTTKIIGVTKNLTLKKGEKAVLKPSVQPFTSRQKLRYSSSKKKVATVSSKGVIKAKKAGKATITVKSGSKKVKVKVTVR